MNRIVIITCLLSLFVSQEMSAQQARIKIDTDRKIGRIDKNIYGNFVEHLGRCVYGGIYDPSSAKADEDGLRSDVLDAVRGLNVSLTRYPGGNFVSNYHWLDGVGPERVPRMELAWARLETNEFGTDEFVAFARKVGTEPYFAVNLGTGSIVEAQSWVEYCNVKEGPYYAELRRKYGHEEPFNIKYWGLGNEMDGDWQMGQLSAEDYVKKAREAAKLMRSTSHDIKLIASGSSNYAAGADPYHWNATILAGLKSYIDYIALHMYVGNYRDNYYDFLATPLEMDERTQVVRGMILREKSRRPVYIAWDEYNVWYRARSGDDVVGNRALEERYNLEDALVITGFLNCFVRNADIVKMANMAQLVNVIAPIFTEGDELILQTIYYPLQMYANNVQGESLDVFVDSPAYDTTPRFSLGDNEANTHLKDVPYLDVTAALDGDRLVICVLNRHKNNAISTEIICQQGAFSGPVEVYEINGPDIKSENDFGKTNVQTVRKDDLKKPGASFDYAFPAHSVTMFKGKIK
ncbi:MAG: alpha-L-arabinofuranosidase C-terminal domain-containing protein [Bacteroidales bacterium]